MPGYKHHIAFGFFSYICALLIIFSSLFFSSKIVEWGICVLCGALFPDIDIKSKGQLLFYHLFLIAACFLMIFERWRCMSALVFLSYIPILSRHRGIFHNFWFITAIIGCLAYCSSSFYPCHSQRIYYDCAFFMLGVFSHLVLDKGLLKTIRLS